MVIIVIIGAGSMVFTRKLISDMLQFDVTRDAMFRLVDIDSDRLATTQKMASRMLQEAQSKGSVQAFSDRRQALQGAHYVINTIQVGGLEAGQKDFDIPERYGIKQTVGDTLGIGGIFRALRTIPRVWDIVKDVEEVAPNAIFLNYTNPMSMVVMGIAAKSGLTHVGLCHSVHHTINQLAEYLGVSPENLRWRAAGINHMAWILALAKENEDLYPALFTAGHDPKIWARDPVRFELMYRLGYFVSESSQHNAEYSAWFIPHESERNRLDISVGAYLRTSVKHLEQYEQLKEALHEVGNTFLLPKSPEYAPRLIEARESGGVFAFQGNVMNSGPLIDNLPADACVEVPCFFGRQGLFASLVGSLPLPLAAANRLAINVQQLTVQALIRGDRDLVYQAAMMDPHLASVLTVDQMRRMVDDLFEAHGNLVPPLESQRLYRLGGTASY